MLNIMTKDPNFVSVRLPDDVANWLREYATANKLIRADKPNMGGSIIAVIRSVKSGQTISNNVGQSSAVADVDIEGIVNDAIAAKLSDLRAEFEEHEAIYTSRYQRNFEEQCNIFRGEMSEAIAPLLARLEALETNRSEATAPVKKLKIVA